MTRFPHQPAHLRAIMDEFFWIINENEPQHLWYMPGPPVRTKWRIGAAAFYEECLAQRHNEKDMLKVLRWTCRQYKKDMRDDRGKAKNPKTPGSVVNWIADYVPPMADDFFPVSPETPTTEELRERIEKLEGRQWPEDY